MESTIHLTQSGKKCKKCLQRGGPCHLHGGSPSPKKTSPKSYPTSSPKLSSSTAAWLSDLPGPALFQVLLNMDQHELNAACRTHSSAAKICSTKRFQEEYNQKHKHEIRYMIEGNLEKIPRVKQTDPTRRYINHLFIDEAGNGIEAQISSGRKNAIRKLKYIPNFSKNGEYMILRKNHKGVYYMEFEKAYTSLKGEELRQFLKKMKKEYWLDKSKLNYKAVFKIFLNAIRKATGFKKLHFEKL
jgi:hypothetical protein